MRLSIIIAALFGLISLADTQAAGPCQEAPRKGIVHERTKGYEPVAVFLKVRTTDAENDKVGFTAAARFRFWIAGDAPIRYDGEKFLVKIDRCSFAAGVKKIYFTIFARALPQEGEIRTFAAGIYLPKTFVAKRPQAGTTLDLPDGEVEFTGEWSSTPGPNGRRVATLSLVQDGSR